MRVFDLTIPAFIISTFMLTGCIDNEITPPADVPVAPRLLRAVAVGDTAVLLAWEDVSPNEDGVQIYESVHPDSEFVLVETIYEQNADSAFLGGKDGDTPYRYKVQAFNLLGGSAFSVEARLLDPEQVDYFDSHSGSENLCLTVSPDGRYAAIGKRTYNPDAMTTLECWNIATGQLKFNHSGSSSISSVAFSADGRFLAAGENSPAFISIWDIEAGALIDSIDFQGNDGLVDIAFNPIDGYLAAATYNISISTDQPTPGEITVYSSSNWGVLRNIEEAHPNRISALAFSPDGTMMASASWEARIRLWSGSGSVAINSLSIIEGRIDDLCFSRDNTLLASASRDSLVRLWDVADGALQGFLKEGKRDVNAVAFSPDGFFLVSLASPLNPKFWDYRRMTQVLELQELPEFTQADFLAFTPDGEKLLIADNQGIYVLRTCRE